MGKRLATKARPASCTAATRRSGCDRGLERFAAPKNEINNFGKLAITNNTCKNLTGHHLIVKKKRIDALLLDNLEKTFPFEHVYAIRQTSIAVELINNTLESMAGKLLELFEFLLNECFWDAHALLL